MFLRSLLSMQLIALAAAWLAAELFYKFPGFSFECFDALIHFAKHPLGLGYNRISPAADH
jgi:hypothetical protein